MKPANLPHSHPARPARSGYFRIISALLLAAACVPALASTTETAQPANQAAATPVVAAAATPVVTAATAAILPAAPAIPALSAELASPQPAITASDRTRTARAMVPQAASVSNDRSLVRTVMQRAFSLLGTPYRWGGTSPESGFDCSGLVGYVFRTIGINLPRVSRAMAGEGTPVTDRSALAEGDLVFFGRRGRIDHVGIYIGNGMFVHSPRTGRDVTVSSLSDGYWSQKFLSARRLAVGS